MSKLAKCYDVSGCNSVDAMLEVSQTNWDVTVEDAKSGSFESGGFRALVRPDTHTALAFVGSKYRTNSHRKQLLDLDPFVRNGDLIPANVSVWDNGALMAYQLRAPELDVTVHDRDVVSPLLTLVFAYGFPVADSAFFADFRWFCKNQLGKVSKLTDERIRHKGDVHGRYADLLGRRLGELKGELADHYRLMGKMAQKELRGRALHQYFGEAIGATKEETEMAWVTPAEDIRGTAAKIPEILECYQVDDAGAEGTVWQAYNAVTRYQTHKAGRTAENRVRNVLLGTGAKVAANAYEAAARMVA